MRKTSSAILTAALISAGLLLAGCQVSPEWQSGWKAAPKPEQDAQEPQPEGPAAAPGERVYIMEAQLGDVVLSLGYIVARTNNPFAEINGVDVYVGSEIESFVVEAIEADRVVLRNDKGPLVLRVP